MKFVNFMDAPHMPNTSYLLKAFSIGIRCHLTEEEKTGLQHVIDKYVFRLNDTICSLSIGLIRMIPYISKTQISMAWEVKMEIIVKKYDSNDNVCLVAPTVFEKLNLSEGSYILKVGHLSENVMLKKSAEQGNVVYVPVSAFTRLLLIDGIQLNIWTVDQEIHLGPVVGIFVNKAFISDIAKGVVPKDAVKDMQANKVAKCLVYYFSLDQIRWDEKTIQGYTRAPNSRKWIVRMFAFPNVIYDCGVKFKPSQKPDVKWIRKQFADNPNIQLINNSDYLGKWTLYERLSKYPEIQQYLPETLRFKTFDDIKSMMEKHNVIYIKSFYGSRGREVMSINKTKKMFILKYYEDGLKKIVTDNFEQLENKINRFMAEKPRIIQKGIDLSAYKGRKFDLRVLICKDGSGQWKDIYNQANLAKKGASITTIGKNIRNYKHVYRYLRRKRRGVELPADKIIRRNTMMIASYIDKEFGSHGELGMDMAVDRKGKIWFIEANSKPEKLPISGVEDTKGVSPQYLSIFEYAKYLAKKADGAL
jgi:hypothetical protein